MTQYLTKARLRELEAEDIRAATACHDWCLAQPAGFEGKPPQNLCDAADRAETALRNYRIAMREERESA